MRIATDMGGTFTDLVVDRGDGSVTLFKTPTTPADPLRGVLDVVSVAAAGLQMSVAELLQRTETFTHGTTRSLNALLTGNTARTALLTTEGHPDILLFREGGRGAAFDFTREYPRPLIPRQLTFEVPGRIGADGEEVRPLDVAEVKAIAAELVAQGVEAAAVCLLWSVVNASHELRVGELLSEYAPDIAVTLSHWLNPTVREYRRASSAAINATLTPLMGSYLRALKGELRAHGFQGRLLINTSSGGVQDAADIAVAPIHTINSGPAMAPVAGRHYSRIDAQSELAIVADTGGTSYDVSLVRGGRIPVTQEAWIGERHNGHITGFPGVDVRSVGAGGGSIAWVDRGGMLRIGPQSAGSEPGPICYARGGTNPTVTDACLVLGFIDAEYFLGGRMKLDVDAATRGLEDLGRQLRLGVQDTASAVLEVATELMVGAIQEIALNQGVSAAEAVLVGGGGAAGFNSAAIARRLGCRRVVHPALGAALSAAGALMSDLTSEYARTAHTDTDNFDFDLINHTLDELSQACSRFSEGPGHGAIRTDVELLAEARYPSQVWQLEVPLTTPRFRDVQDLERFRRDFHRVHRELFTIDDPDSPVEIVGWRARARCRIHDRDLEAELYGGEQLPSNVRPVYFNDTGWVETPVVSPTQLSRDARFGPLIVESPVTTIVVDPSATVRATSSGSVVIELQSDNAMNESGAAS